MLRISNSHGGYTNGYAKGNRRVVPSCVLWKRRNSFSEINRNFIPYDDRNKD